MLIAREVYERSGTTAAISSLAVYLRGGARPPTPWRDALRTRPRRDRAAGDAERRPAARGAPGLRPHLRGDRGAARCWPWSSPSSGSGARSWRCRWSARASSRTLLALGLTPAQLWGLTLLETGLMGLAAGLLSLPTGAAARRHPGRRDQRALVRLDHALELDARRLRPGPRAERARRAARARSTRCGGCGG